MTNPVSGGFQFTPPTGLNDVATYPTTPVSETAARQQVMDFYWQLMNEMNKPTLSAAAYAQYNRLINGGFAVNQRVVSGTVTLAAGQYGHDRWKAGAGGCTYTFSTTNNVTTITITAGSLVQVIEGINLVSGTYTLSWTGTAQGKIGAGVYSASGVTGVATGGTNLTIEFNTGTLSKVQLNAGDQALPFQPRSFAEELVMCQRYNIRINATASAGVFGTGQATSTTTANLVVDLGLEMRVVPTFSSSGSFRVSSSAGAALVVTGLSLSSPTSNKRVVQLSPIVSSGLVAGDATTLNANSDISAYLNFDAEL